MLFFNRKSKPTPQPERLFPILDLMTPNDDDPLYTALLWWKMMAEAESRSEKEIKIIRALFTDIEPEGAWDQLSPNIQQLAQKLLIQWCPDEEAIECVYPLYDKEAEKFKILSGLGNKISEGGYEMVWIWIRYYLNFRLKQYYNQLIINLLPALYSEFFSVKEISWLIQMQLI